MPGVHDPSFESYALILQGCLSAGVLGRHDIICSPQAIATQQRLTPSWQIGDEIDKLHISISQFPLSCHRIESEAAVFECLSK